MALNYLAPSPYASIVTRNGNFQADVNGLISNVSAGMQALDLLEAGCVPLAYNPFANFRNLIDGGDFSINPFQRKHSRPCLGRRHSYLPSRRRRPISRTGSLPPAAPLLRS